MQNLIIQHHLNPSPVACIFSSLSYICSNIFSIVFFVSFLFISRQPSGLNAYDTLWAAIDTTPAVFASALVSISFLECTSKLILMLLILFFTLHVLLSSNVSYFLPKFFFPLFFQVLSFMAINDGRNSGRAPGFFAFNPMGMGKTAASMKDLEVKEVRNGRLAMWGCAGILHVEATQHISALHPILP